MVIVHLADTHIKNLRFHEDYTKVFNYLFSAIRQEEPDIIVHCGDIAHTKTSISPEFVEMTHWFLESLVNIAPTYIILGNHDGNLKNKNRQDAITPIVKAIGNPNLKLLKNSGETKVNDEVTLNVLSVFDRENWTKPTEPEKINIALYHGSISGAKTDLGYVLKDGQDKVDIFKDFDYAMLGDIHTQQKVDKEGRIWYCGSTIQQNHGEKNDKGYLVWEIDSKTSWTVEPVVLYNPHPFITITLDKNGEVNETTDVSDKRVRVIDENGLSNDILRESLANIRKNDPKSISFVSKKTEKTQNRVHNKVQNLRDPVIQNELIRDFLSNKGLLEDEYNEIFRINEQINTLINEEQLARNTFWSIKTFKWSGLFIYESENQIDFKDYQGLIGIFGKNYTGKSSIIDSILFTIFGSTSKREKKLINVLNNKSTRGYGEITIECDNKLYTIKREIKRTTKTTKGIKSETASSAVDFYCKSGEQIISLNDLTRTKTDKVIQSIFGSYEDFSLSSLVSQMDSYRFLNEGTTKRKEIVANFLDLQIFEEKLKLAKEEVSQTKALIKKLSSRDHDTIRRDLVEKTKNSYINLSSLKEGEEYSITKNRATELVNIGAIRQQVENLKEEQQELRRLEKIAKLYDYYIEAVHPSGIPFSIIQQKVPFINQQISDNLIGIVDFEVYLECDNQNLDIFIKREYGGASPIEMASGAEKTLASMAIRLALLSVSSLPKADLFVLDEPGTSLDEDNLSGFIDMLELIKISFGTTFLISHLPTLKDCVDREIVINKLNNITKII